MQKRERMFLTKPCNGKAIISLNLKDLNYPVELYPDFPEKLLASLRVSVLNRYDFYRHCIKRENQMNLTFCSSYYEFGIVQIANKLYSFRTQPEGPELKLLKIVADVSPKDSALVQLICLLEAAVKDIENNIDDWVPFSSSKKRLREQLYMSQDLLDNIREEEFYSLIDWDYSDEPKDYCEWKIDPVSPNQILNPHVQERENIVTAKYCPCCGKVIKARGM